MKKKTKLCGEAWIGDPAEKCGLPHGHDGLHKLPNRELYWYIKITPAQTETCGAKKFTNGRGKLYAVCQRPPGHKGQHYDARNNREFD